ncbi:hypothetical protein [Actinomadura atramentaria]|uniref:hypothetical protein n=1 Tax=Actinomadura atramentaria TaxID=1990 RepID=UPI00036B91CB|nr:hypothetical protein [Actinomadura atramentaria]
MPEDAPTAAELDKLSSAELHDRAVARAKERHDLGFLWELLREIPAAAAATGEVDRAEYDMLHVVSLLEEFRGAGDGDLADALRPVYVSYLTEHGD